MNKILRFSLISLLALVFKTTFAADAYKTLTFPDENQENNKVGAYTETWEATIGTDSWDITNFNNNRWQNWSYIRCGRKNNPSVASIATKFAMGEALSSVVVTIDKITASNVNSISLQVASDAAFNDVVETVNAESLEAGEMIFNVSKAEKNLYYKLVFDCASASGNGIIQVSKVQYYKAGDEPEIVDISNTPETAYTVAKAHELTEAGEGLATSVYIKGIVTEITEVSTQYGNATYYINDTDSKDGQLMIFRGKYFGGENFTAEEQLNLGDEVIVYGQLSVYAGEHQVAQNNVIYSINGKTEPEKPAVDISNTPETAYTVAKANELIAAGEGLDTEVYVKGKITNVEEVSTQFGNATYYINDTEDTEGQLCVFRGYFLNGDKFTSEDQIKVGDEVIVYGKLTNHNGKYEIDTGNKIYSLNGKTEIEPTVDISNTPETAYTVAKANELIAAGEGLETEVYVQGIITSVEEVSTQFGNATYYINDTEATEGQLCVFRGYYLNGDKFTSEDQIKAGDKVIVYGKLMNYNGTYEIGTGNRIYSINNITTGINNVETDTEDANAPVYNLSGQRVNDSYKGIVIKNGKKYINR